MKGLEDLLNSTQARRESDAKRYVEQDYDLCVICHAYGEDKRSLFIDCWYEIAEVVSEALAIHMCGLDQHKEGWYLRVCKSCRRRFLSMLGQWAEAGRRLRNASKNHDGIIKEGDESRCIPVRVHGAVVMMNQAEYDDYCHKVHGAPAQPSDEFPGE